jgi:hypothetical protein
MSKTLALSTATFQPCAYALAYTGTKILGNGKVTYSDHKEYDFTTYSDGEIRLFGWHSRNGIQLVNSPKRLELLRSYLEVNHTSALPLTPAARLSALISDDPFKDVPMVTPTQDNSTMTQERPLLLQEFCEGGQYFVLVYHENIPGICDLVVETDPRRDRNTAIDAATDDVEEFCRRAGLDFARDVAWCKLSAPLPNGIAIKPLASCEIGRDVPSNTRALLVEMANAMTKLFGTCELNMDDLEEDTCETLTECDALLDRVRSYLASN